MSNILENMIEFRRRAYVDCLMQMKKADNVIGTFGKVDEALLRGYGLVPVPIVGVDAHIFEHGEYDSCDPIKSTIIYLTTMKCPLLYSSKMYYFNNGCPRMHEAIELNTEKPIYVHGYADELSEKLKEVYGASFNETVYDEAKQMLAKIGELVDRLYESDMSGRDVYAVDFYSKYIIDLNERYEVIGGYVNARKSTGSGERKVLKVACPGGILASLENVGSDVRICDCADEPKIVCNGCIHDAPIHINY